MFEKSAPPFNLLGWSFGLLILFFIVQLVLSLPYAMAGFQLGPWMMLLTWFGVSAGVGVGLQRRFQPRSSHMMILQAMSVTYVFCISLAVALKGGAPFSVGSLFHSFSLALVLFFCGASGFLLAAYLQGRKSS